MLKRIIEAIKILAVSLYIGIAEWWNHRAPKGRAEGQWAEEE